MGAVLDTRRTYCTDKLQQLRISLVESETLIDGKACVYTTGSFARGEASTHSDLDLFIIGLEENDQDKDPLLKNVDAICLKADLIRATKNFGLPEFSGDGEYLVHYTKEELIKNTGLPSDDHANTFTARLLLLLESEPLLGDAVYSSVIDSTIDKYWRDYDKHKDNFSPAFLINDILRLWRTFCVNYEARTSSDPHDKRIKRKLKNYKLKHSRLLTCYSAVAHLIVTAQEKPSISQDDARVMVKLTPTKRIEAMGANTKLPVHSRDCAHQILERYEVFLENTAKTETELMRTFADPEQAANYMKESVAFSESFYSLLLSLDNTKPLYRLLSV